MLSMTAMAIGVGSAAGQDLGPPLIPAAPPAVLPPSEIQPPAPGPQEPSPAAAVTPSPDPGLPAPLPNAPGPTNGTLPDLRDPFWPVGYVPPPPKPPAPLVTNTAEVIEVEPFAPDWLAAHGKLTVRGVMGGADGSYVATVNGRLVSVGDLVSLEHDGALYRWRIKAITARGVETEEIEANPLD